ncbi:DUF7793 family protein [Pseudarthrobacter enclensis]|uniref:DUF7793 domain-containing protein n=1 Tax=Pseudarthrobacter enclensis TaxID=993070 RepID=A0ABT9RZB4_9MICC|nr:hypothetical protein [Pseudarthrobacter enclensis]MDP9890587.1 hypothetical protein [Pseudarthrobacter enclensis]
MNRIDIPGKGTFELSRRVPQMWYKPGATVDSEEVRAWITAMDNLGNGVPLPVLINIQGVTFSAPARKIFPDGAHVSRMPLLGSSPVDRVVAMFRLPLLPVDFPMRYFTSAEQALAWLLEPPEASVHPGTGARDFGRSWATGPGPGPGNQESQDAAQPGKRGEEHQADRR